MKLTRRRTTTPFCAVLQEYSTVHYYEVMKLDSNSWYLVVLSQYEAAHGTRTCIKRKKKCYGKFFDFCAEKCI